MGDYDRFLAAARDHAAHVHRIAERLHAKGKIGTATLDALDAAARDLFHDAYQAGRSEPAGVTDLLAELARTEVNRG